MKFIAYCTKGLEEVVKSEIESVISDAKILEVGDKRIIFECKADFKRLIMLRTVDDLGILILTLPDVENLDALLSEIDEVDFTEIRNELGKYREILNSFSVTASFAGVKNFSSDDLIKSLSKQISKKYGWDFTELNHSNFDMRVFIDHDIGYVSVRLTKESL